MFSGSNPGAELYWANALAQAQSQNNSLDWALLAQQWISHQQNISSNIETNVRGSSDFVNPADAPPPPKLSFKNNEEQGEADMDVEDDQSEPENQNFVAPPPPQLWSISTSAPIPMPVIPQQLPMNAPWNIWNTPGMLNTNLPPPSLHIPEITSPLVGNNKISKPSVIPSLMDTPVTAPIDSQFPTLDAAKRKTLPAWIREGLEKMEREKLKQLEREKAVEAAATNKNENKYDKQSFIENLQTVGKSDIIGINRTNINSSNYKGFLKNSAATSDESDKSDNESDLEKTHLKKETSLKINPWKGKTFEEIEEEMMLVVRRSLTEILLEVTNEEIRNIAHETLKRHKLKASSAQVIRKSALTSISGNLGLGAYDSDSSNNSDTDDETNKKDDDKDSEDEIRESLLNRQRSFKTIAREISALIEKEEARQDEIRQERLRREQLERSSERLLSQSGSNNNDNNIEYLSNIGSTGNFVGNSNGVDSSQGHSKLRKTNYDRDFGETHHDKKSYSSNGQKRLKERTSRFSDNKESKTKPSTSSATASSAGYLLPITNNSLNSTNLLNSTTSTVSAKLIQQHQQSSTAQILPNTVAAQNFLMANAVLCEAFLKNDKKKLSSSSLNKRNKRNKKSRSRSRSRSSNISSTTSSSNKSDNKSRRGSHSSRRTVSSVSSNSSKSSEVIKNKNKNKRSKSKDVSQRFDEKTESKRRLYKNSREDDDHLDSVEYNHSRSYYRYHKSSHRRSHSSDEDRSSTTTRDDERSSSHNYYNENKYSNKRNRKSRDRDHDNDDDVDKKQKKRHHDNSPDSDDYYRSRRRYHTNSTSSRSSNHKNDKKDYYYSTNSDRKRSYSRRDDSRSRSRSKSKSHSSRDKYHDKY